MNLLGKAGRIFLIVLNVIFVILGIALIVIGAEFYDQGALIDSNILPLLDALDVGGINLGDIIQALATIIIILGVFVLGLSLCAVIGAIFKIRPCLFVYAVIVILLCILEIIVIGLVITLIDELNSSIKSSLISALSTYEGESGDALTVAWNFLFLALDCCGVNKQTQVDDFASTTWAASRSPDVIPGYCCVGATSDTISSQTCTTSPTSTNSYIESGCYDNLHNTLNSFSIAVATVMFIILVVEIVAVVASFIMVWQITKDIKDKKAKNKVHPNDDDKKKENISMSEVS